MKLSVYAHYYSKQERVGFWPKWWRCRFKGYQGGPHLYTYNLSVFGLWFLLAREVRQCSAN